MRTHLIRLVGILLVAGMCFSFSRVYAAAPDIDLLNKLQETSTNSPESLKILINTYCSTVLADKGFSNDTFRYDAKYSAFVYLLCSNIDPGRGAGSKLKSDYFKISSFKDLGFTDISLNIKGGFDNCNPGYMDNDCDLASNVPMLFNSIMEDYVNIKQAGLYGYLTNFSSDDELSTIMNEYFVKYFEVDICNNTKHPYDKTCRMVKSYIKNLRNIMTEVRIFDTEQILALQEKKEDSCADTSRDIFYCGLKDKTTAMVSFVNLLYNEIYYYRLFIGYYITMIQQYPEINSDYGTILQKFSMEYARSKSAMSLSLRMMRDMYMAFPFHVGLSMYQEDIDAFNRTLANIATPIYTLYDKLRNVQKPD